MKKLLIIVFFMSLSGCTSTTERRLANLERLNQEQLRNIQIIAERSKQAAENSARAEEQARKATWEALQAREDAKAAKSVTDRIDIIEMPGGGIIRPRQR